MRPPAARGRQNLRRIALVNQLLPVPARHVHELGASVDGIHLHDAGHRDDASDPRQRGDLGAQPLRRIDMTVLLDDELAVEPRLVGVPMSKPTLRHTPASHRSSRH